MLINSASEIFGFHGGEYENDSFLPPSDDGGVTRLWNVGLLQWHYTAIYTEGCKLCPYFTETSFNYSTVQ